MLSVEGLTAGYHDLTVLRGISLEVKDGEFVGLVGANAAGKTTFAKSITGLLRPSAGTVSWAGQPITALAANKRPELGLVMVPEGRSLFPYMTVRENLELGATNKRASDNAARNIEKVFDLFPVLQEKAKVPARTLSGGQQQMLAIGRALMAEPRLLILDEPSVGLSPKIVSEIYALLDVIFSEGTSILLIDQDVNQCLKVVQRAYVMAQGRIVLRGDAQTLLTDDSVRRTYLGLLD
jgi:branched-chain amino acid transport system ATP-binding protein